MKKGLRFLIIFVAFVVILSTAVYAATWEYKFPITVTDTSNTTRAYYPVDMGFTGQILVDSGKIASSGLDSNAQISASSIKYMFTTTKTFAVIPSLTANGQQTVDIYTGYDPAQTAFALILGDAGYITVTDAPALEPAGNFSLEVSGYIDAGAGANKDLIYKAAAIRLYISGANTITGTVTGSGTVSSAITSGEHVVKLYTDGGNLKLDIDAVNVDSDATLAVPDTADNWILDQNEVMPYITYYKHTVGGVLIAWYQPNTMLVGTAVVDRQGGDQGGVITWGTNTSISLSYGAMETSESVTAVGETGEVTGFTVENSIIPATWFAAGENMANLPFYDSFLSVSQQTGQPVQTLYFMGIIGLAFGVFLLLTLYTRAALLGAIGFNIVLFIGSSMTIVPMWIPFVTLITMLALMYLYRQVAY